MADLATPCEAFPHRSSLRSELQNRTPRNSALINIWAGRRVEGVNQSVEKPPVILPSAEIKLAWSREFVKRRARRCLARSSYRIFSIICISIALCAAVGFAFDHRPEMQSIYPLYFFFPVLPAVVYGWRYLKLTRISHKHLDQIITIRIGSEAVSFDEGKIVTTLRWPAIKRLWKFPDMFLLSPDMHGLRFATIPVDSLPEEIKSFIENKVRESGGVIT